MGVRECLARCVEGPEWGVRECLAGCVEGPKWGLGSDNMDKGTIAIYST